MDDIRIRQFIEQARAKNISEEEAMAYLRSVGRIGGATTPQAQPEPQPQEQGFLSKATDFVAGGVKDWYKGEMEEGRQRLEGKSFGQRAREQFTPGAVAEALPVAGMLVDRDREGKVSYDPEGLRAQADIASLAVPAGKTAKGAMALGAGAGALKSFAEEEDIGMGMLGGAVGGGLLFGGGKLAGGMVKELKEGGKSLIRKVFQASGDRSPRFFHTREALIEVADNLGLTGSVTKMLEKVNDLYDEGVKQVVKISRTAKPKGAPIKAGSLKRQIYDEVSANATIGTKSQINQVNDIIRKIVPFDDDIRLKPAQLGQVYKNVRSAPGSRVTRAFDAMEKGGTLARPDEAWLSAYNVVNDVFKNKAQGVDDVLLEMSKLHELSSGLRRAETVWGIKPPLTDIKVGGRATSRLVGGAGRKAVAASEMAEQFGIPELADLLVTAQPAQTGARLIGQESAAGKSLPTTPPALGEEAAGAGLPTTPPALGATDTGAAGTVWDGMSEPQSGQTDEEGYWQWNGVAWIMTPQHVQAAIQQDYLETGGKNSSKIANAYKQIREAAGGGDEGFSLSDVAIENITDLSSGLNMLQDLKVTFEEGGKTGAIPWLKSLSPFSVEAKKTKQLIATVRQKVGKALEGGVLRKEDELKYKDILAQMINRPELAIAKTDELINMLQRDLDSYIQMQRQFGKGSTQATSGAVLTELGEY